MLKQFIKIVFIEGEIIKLGEMKIYLAKLDSEICHQKIKYFLDHVTLETKDRFHSFKFINDGLRTLYGEIIIRYILSKKYLLDPIKINFFYNRYGKPYVLDIPVCFNISHSGEWVVCAVDSKPIGIDIEHCKAIDVSTAGYFFTKEENQYIELANGENKIKRFYDIWTLKESYIKWLGVGLSRALDSFHLKIQDEEILIFDKNISKKPFFKQYFINDYKLSVCSTENNFPENIEIIDLKNLYFNHY